MFVLGETPKWDSNENPLNKTGKRPSSKTAPQNRINSRNTTNSGLYSQQLLLKRNYSRYEGTLMIRKLAYNSFRYIGCKLMQNTLTNLHKKNQFRIFSFTPTVQFIFKGILFVINNK